VRAAETTAVNLLRRNRPALERLVAELLEHETLTGEEVRLAVGGPDPGGEAPAPRAPGVTGPARR
jgi:ATP-dependent Zn protease